MEQGVALVVMWGGGTASIDYVERSLVFQNSAAMKGNAVRPWIGHWQHGGRR